MTRRAIVITMVITGMVGLGAVWLVTPMCGCTPVPDPPVPAPSQVAELWDRLWRAQERYYSAHGRYTVVVDSLSDALIPNDWRVRIDVGNQRGFDLQLDAPSEHLRCFYRVRRPSDDTPIARHGDCYSDTKTSDA